MTLALALGCGALAGAGMLVRPRRGPRFLAGGAAGRSGGWRRLLGRRPRSAVSGLGSLGRTVGSSKRLPLPEAVVLALVDDLATQVRAGASPAHAWAQVVATTEHVREAAATGESPRECLERWVDAPGAPASLRALAAAWALCEDVGSPLAGVLDRVADAAREDAEIDAEIAAALAAPKATARLLAALPAAGLALGQLVGAHPVNVLLHTSTGRLCAVAGLVLALVGRWWAHRLVERTEALL